LLLVIATREKEVDDVADLNGKWEGMKKACLERTEEVCGWTNGPQRHKDTWWWNEDVRVALDNKKDCFRALSQQMIGELMLTLGTMQRR
jgi:hypothetical protein